MADNNLDTIYTASQNENMNASSGIAHIKLSINNIIVTMSDINGNVIAWKTPKALGFKGARKSTAIAAKVTGDTVARKALELGIQTVEVKVKGKGNDACGDAVIDAIKNTGIEIISVTKEEG
jgi:small subunit ribosomal protein S11